MTFRPDLRSSALLAGLGLVLSACSIVGEEESSVEFAPVQGSDEFIQLIESSRSAMREGSLPAAGGMLDQAHRLEQDNPALWVAVARLRFRGGEHLSALEAAERALEVGPTSPLALHLRGQMVRDAHGLADALPWFEAAHKAAPKDPDILADLAATLGDLGRNTDMLVEVRKLAELDAGHPKVHYLQAILAARAGRPVFARSLLERSRMLEDQMPGAVMLDGLLHLSQGDHDLAAEKLEELAHRQPGNVRVLELLARALWLGGRDRDLIDRFAARVRLPDASPYLLELVGRAHERQGDRETAAPFLERAAAGRRLALVLLGSTPEGRAILPAPTRQLRKMIGDRDRAGALRLANSLRRQFPLSADVHSLVGDVAMVNSGPDAALEIYQISAQIRRPWPLTQRIIAAHRLAGNDEAADMLLIQHLTGEPNNTEALLMLAQRSALADDWLRVAVLIDQAIELGAGNDPSLLMLRAEAASQLDRKEEADRFVEWAEQIRVTEFVPNDMDDSG